MKQLLRENRCENLGPEGMRVCGLFDPEAQMDFDTEHWEGQVPGGRGVFGPMVARAGGPQQDGIRSEQHYIKSHEESRWRSMPPPRLTSPLGP